MTSRSLALINVCLLSTEPLLYTDVSKAMDWHTKQPKPSVKSNSITVFNVFILQLAWAEKNI